MNLTSKIQYVHTPTPPPPITTILYSCVDVMMKVNVTAQVQGSPFFSLHFQLCDHPHNNNHE